MTLPKVFLTADWRRLVMLNYPVDEKVLRPLVPRHTELDLWQGSAYVSLVGFRFLDTRVKGIPVPFHRDFDEINLRFYVRREGPDGTRRGVVFVKEVVPRIAIAATARWLYNENYVACRTDSSFRSPTDRELGEVSYRWTHRGSRLEIGCSFRGEASLPAPGSEEEFITEHYWGYSAQKDGGTVEYRVEHPQWRVWSGEDHRCSGEMEGFYGPAFEGVFEQEPTSAFVADGSPVIVRGGVRLSAEGAPEGRVE